MKKPPYIFLLGAIWAASLAYAAPQQSEPPQPQQQQTPRDIQPAPAPPYETTNLRQRLALNADQVAQLHAINKDRKAQAAAIQSDASLSKPERRQKLKSVQVAADSKIRAMLTENQAAEYDQILRERREKQASRRQTALPPG